MSSRIKRRVRIGGGQYVTKYVNLTKDRSIYVPKEAVPTETPIETKTEAAQPIDSKGKVKNKVVKTNSLTNIKNENPIVQPNIVISKPETKAKRNEILKAINDALTGVEMKPIKQKGGFLRQLI